MWNQHFYNFPPSLWSEVQLTYIFVFSIIFWILRIIGIGLHSRDFHTLKCSHSAMSGFSQNYIFSALFQSFVSQLNCSTMKSNWQEEPTIIWRHTLLEWRFDNHPIPPKLDSLCLTLFWLPLHRGILSLTKDCCQIKILISGDLTKHCVFDTLKC